MSTPRLQIDLLTLICTWEMITVSLLFEFQSGRASLLTKKLPKNFSLTGFASGPGFYIGHVVTQPNKIEFSFNTFPVTFTVKCRRATWTLYIILFKIALYCMLSISLLDVMVFCL